MTRQCVCFGGSGRVPRGAARIRRRAPGRRRAVASVLAMMFLVIFGSLAAAMAVVAQGNLRTADSALKVSRAMSAAETGLVFAASRLLDESGRFVVSKGVIDSTFGEALWSGTLSTAEYDLLPPSGYSPGDDAIGIMDAIADAHLFDDHAIEVLAGDGDLPIMDVDAGTLWVKPIGLASGAGAPYFRLRYEFEIVDDVPRVRVVSEGVDADVTRTLSISFTIEKKIEYAVLSPNRIMIGKNVLVEGPLGSLYGIGPNELDTANGDPLVMRSDFYYLDPALDANLDTFFAALIAGDADVDGDGRLRVYHPVESAALAGNPALVDYDEDEYVDDFDLFLKHFDADDDQAVVYNDLIAVGETEEFNDGGGDVIDLQLARLIDFATPDRNGDGVVDLSDQSLGYGDGILDVLDVYAKVSGGLAFAVLRADWEAAAGESYQTVVQGPIRSDSDDPPVEFGVTAEDLLEIQAAMLGTNAFVDAGYVTVPGGFGLPPNALGPDPALLLSDAIVGGTVANYTAPGVADWEPVPFGSAGAYDYYQRPVYRDMTFSNVTIPMGNNGLFENCVFVGVTFIQSESDCDKKDWNYAGALKQEPDGLGGFNYVLRFDTIPDPADIANNDIVADTRTISNNIRFHDCTFLGSLTGSALEGYTHWRNKVQMTGFTRFYIDVVDVDPSTLTDGGGVLFTDYLAGLSAAQISDMRKSSILLPDWSVDVGNFNNTVDADPDLTPSINLKGVIIAGIFDVRGTADILGTLLMTFRPDKADTTGPLAYGGQPDAFNTTIGYFGPQDGDDEGQDPGAAGFNGFGEIRLRYDPDALLPDGIPWPVKVSPVARSYTEGGA